MAVIYQYLLSLNDNHKQLLFFKNNDLINARITSTDTCIHYLYPNKLSLASIINNMLLLKHDDDIHKITTHFNHVQTLFIYNKEIYINLWKNDLNSLYQPTQNNLVMNFFDTHSTSHNNLILYSRRQHNLFIRQKDEDNLVKISYSFLRHNHFYHDITKYYCNQIAKSIDIIHYLINQNQHVQFNSPYIKLLISNLLQSIIDFASQADFNNSKLPIILNRFIETNIDRFIPLADYQLNTFISKSKDELNDYLADIKSNAKYGFKMILNNLPLIIDNLALTYQEIMAITKYHFEAIH